MKDKSFRTKVFCSKKDLRSENDELRAENERFQKQILEHRHLEERLKETLHDLRVYQEELRTQNEDLTTAQREIANAHAKYVDLFDYAPNGYFLINTRGMITEANLTAANMLKQSRSIILNKPLWIFVQASARERFNIYLRSLWKGRSAVLELDLLPSGGGRVPVELHGVPVRNGNRHPVFCRIIAVDATRRKSAENELRQANQWLDSILATIPDIVYRLNEKGAITYVSGTIRNYGYDPEDFINKSFLTLVHPEDREKARHRLNEKRMDERHTKTLEVRLLNHRYGIPSDSSDCPEPIFSVHAVGLYARDGMGEKRYIGTQGIARDITERKRHECAEQKLLEQLQRSRRMEAIGTLAGGIAHNFNNLLMGIQGSISLLQYKQQSIEETNFLLAAVEDCIQRGSDLTKRLLGFARGGNYVVKPTDMNAIVHSTLRMFHPTRKDIEIIKALAPKVWNVQADQGQMEQVFLNLFINAGQAMPQGGTLKVATRNHTIDCRQADPGSLSPGDYVEIMVEDNGFGMDEKTCSRIFEPFFSTKPVGCGTGLGLASVYGIVKNHGGAIQVKSAVGHGTTFAVHLPVAKKAPVKCIQENASQLEKGDGVILVVDDEKVVIDMVTQMLTTLGYTVKTAADGTEAVDVYRAEWKDIDLVVLDIVMPGLSGIKTYARLKDINPKISVIFASGYSSDDQTEKILKTDQQQFIQKPFNMEKLSTMVHHILKRG